MPVLTVSGVQVDFPFEPYACQLTYMEKVIECLQKGVNGVLESPTGTGKTLCLLCSSLAWLEGRKAQTELNRQVSLSQLMGDQSAVKAESVERLVKSLEKSTGSTWGGTDFAVPKIIYASRTHSQLTQAVQELKRTAYRSMKVSVIGSREQLCIHEQVRKETNNTTKVHMCRAKVNSRTCFYYNHLEDVKKNGDVRQAVGSVVDIEDIVLYGEKNRVCPYYMARELKVDADIIFMPYNYLLDTKSRKAHGVELQGNIVIFDEAHNLEKICEDSASFDLKSSDLATAIEEVTRLSEKLLEYIQAEQQSAADFSDSGMPEPDFNLDDLLRLKATLKDLEEQIDSIEIPHREKGLSKPGLFIFELFARANIGFETKNILIDLLDKVTNYITNDASGAGVSVSKGAGLAKFVDVLKIIFSQDVADGGSVSFLKTSLARSYKVYIQQDASFGGKQKKLDLWTNPGKPDKSGKTLSYWCFSPGHSMSDLIGHGVKAIILTSGTLSPLDSFTAEMQIPFPVRLENPHVIEKHQVWIGILKKGPDGTVLNSNYETRFNTTYQASLGNLIVNFARVVPSGLLIFFPSYPLMEKCLEYWKETNIWGRIEQYKQLFVEPKGKTAFNEVMDGFYNKINDETLNGAIFIAVCRGKVSEGLDFSDNNGRAVIITGLPYPPFMDPKVTLKMKFLDEMKGKQNFKSLGGKEWYRQQASRAVNQAIGRVIRHKEDYGAILLCDTRFSSHDSLSQLPVWVRPHVKQHETFGNAIRDAQVFFKNAEKMMPVPKLKQRRTNTAGCTGAYFMPTISHRGEPTNLERASTVAQHVPSLMPQRHDEEMTVNSLKLQYEGFTATSTKPKSLFDALSINEQTSERLCESQITSFQPNCNAELRRPVVKKKIVIKKREFDTSEVKTTVVSSTAVQSQVNNAENYIAEVKKVLSMESYKVFSKALLEYKKVEDLLKVVGVLADLFTNDPQNFHLFRKFFRYVRSHHKQQFHQMCIDLTGEGCNYKPEDAVSKKRLAEQCCKTNTDSLKKSRIASDKSEDLGAANIKNTKANEKTNVIGEQVLPVSNQFRIACGSGGHEVKQQTSSSVILTGSRMSEPQCQNSKATSGKLHSGGGQSMLSDENDNNLGGRDINSCQKLGDTDSIVEGCGDVPVKNTQNHIAAKYSGLSSKSGYTCCLCHNEASVPFKSQCQHVCCMNCWRKVFE
ncbi:hypothetical protein ACJMK2_041741, partial [Sinanodonta woodiana]